MYCGAISVFPFRRYFPVFACRTAGYPPCKGGKTPSERSFLESPARAESGQALGFCAG